MALANLLVAVVNCLSFTTCVRLPVYNTQKSASLVLQLAKLKHVISIWRSRTVTGNSGNEATCYYMCVYNIMNTDEPTDRLFHQREEGTYPVVTASWSIMGGLNWYVFVQIITNDCINNLTHNWSTEYDIVSTLRQQLSHMHYSELEAVNSSPDISFLLRSLYWSVKEVSSSNSLCFLCFMTTNIVELELPSHWLPQFLS